MLPFRSIRPHYLIVIAVLGMAQLLLGTAQVWHHDHDSSPRSHHDCAVCVLSAQPTLADPGPVISIPVPTVLGETPILAQSTPPGLAAPAALARGPPAA